MALGTSVKPYATEYVLLAMVWVAGFAAGILLFIAFVQSWDNTALAFSVHPAAIAPLVGTALMCMAVAIVLGMRARAAGRLDALRQRAARGDAPHALLAADQPHPLPDEAAAPMTLVIHPAPWITIGLLLYGAYCAWVQTHLDLFGASGGFASLLFLIPIVSDMGLIVVIGLYSALYMRSWQLDASETELVGGRSAPEYMAVVPWRAARLFAVVHRDRRGRPDTFELATATDIVRWRWIRKDNGFWRTYNPGIPWQFYDQDMRTLLSLIAAKTGLPLYDLSGGERLARAVQLAH